MNNRIKLVACSHCGHGDRCPSGAAAAGVGYRHEPAREQSNSGTRRTAHLTTGRARRATAPPASAIAGRGGPALNTTGLKHGDGDADLFRTIRQGVSGTQMPPYKGLRDEQVWQLVSYIRGLQNRGAAPAAARGAMVPEGDVAAGEALFYGKAACASCHEINARGGVTGPDLSNAGRLAAAAIRQKIVSPNDPLPPAPGARGGGGGRGAPASRDDRREDARRPRDSRRAAQRRHVLGADRRRIGPASPAQQAAGDGLGREPLADARRLRHAPLRRRDHEHRRVSADAAGTRPGQDRRAADRRRRRHVSTARQRESRAAQLVDVLGRLLRSALLPADADHAEQRATAEDSVELPDSRRQLRSRSDADRRRRRDVHDRQRQSRDGYRD